MTANKQEKANRLLEALVAHLSESLDPDRVDDWLEQELDALTQDKRVIRNRRKLEAIVGNARRMVDLEEEHEGFGSYLRSHGGFEETVKDLRKQFKFLGEHGTYYFLWVVGEDVPSYEDWCASRGIKPQVPRS